MNNSKHIYVPLSRGEKVWGMLYLPFYLILLAPLLMAAFDALGWSYGTAEGMARLNGIYFLVNFLASVLIFRGFLGHNLVQVGKRFWGFVQAVILGLVLYFVGTYLVGRLVAFLSPQFQNPNDESILQMAGAAPWYIWPGTVILAPVAEECFLRGLVFRGLHNRSRMAAYVVSVLLFAAIHVVGYVDQVPLGQLALSFLQYVPAGIALAWAYEKADSIFAPILMHCLINTLAMMGSGS